MKFIISNEKELDATSQGTMAAFQSPEYYMNTYETLRGCLHHIKTGFADASDIQRWLETVDGAIQSLTNILELSSISPAKKRQYENAAILFTVVRNKLQVSLKRGGDLQQQSQERVQCSTVQSAFEKRIKSCVITNLQHLSSTAFLDDAKSLYAENIKLSLKEHDSLKVFAVLAAEYSVYKDNEQKVETKHFNTKAQPIFRTTNLLEWFSENIQKPVERDMEEFEERDSGWSLLSILSLTLMINKYNPMRGSSYIPLPTEIQRKNACINVKNDDTFCFKYAILSALYPAKDHPYRVNKYTEYENELVFTGLNFPVMPKQVPKFEQQNDVSVNVYILKKKSGKFNVSPCHLTTTKKERHVNLLLLQDPYIDEDEATDVQNESDGELVFKYHYVWIKNLSRLVSSNLSKGKRKLHICDRCLHYFKTPHQLAVHLDDCLLVNDCRIRLPSRGDDILKFKNFKNKERVPFIVYADFECILKPIENDDRAYQLHVPFSVGFYFKCSFDDSKSRYEFYRQQDETEANPAKWFAEKLFSLAKELDALYENPKPMNRLSLQEDIQFEQATTCHICQIPFTKGSKKVKDHCHFTGKYRGPAHNECNINYQDARMVPVVCHNMRGYDSHLFVQEIATIFPGRVTLIPQTKEKYVSFTKYIEDCGVSLRFIDSIQFLHCSLEKLASYLDKTEITEKVFMEDGYSTQQIELLQRKGVFPYDYLSSFDRLKEQELPSKDQFYSSLNESHINDDDYSHAQNVWNVFNVQTLGNYSDLYLKTDVLLLSDVFENFRASCLEAYELDPACYVTTPGLSFDAMLKYTKVELELLTDIDMLMFVERGIRGGISQCSNRYAKANNEYMEDYDAEKTKTQLIYLDLNNLYGWAMTQSLPFGGFLWVIDIGRLEDFLISDDSCYGFILEVDIEYPKEIHDEHKDLPFCPQHLTPPGSKQKKLMATLFDKERYVIHYRALKQALKHGLRVKKIHRVLQFNQKPWLKDYIDLNSTKRQNARNEFEKHLYKLFNNAIYGKTMQNERKHTDVRLVNKFSGRYGAEAFIAKPNFHSCTIFNENCVAIQLSRTEIYMRQPIYVGLAVLDLSKTLLYRFHYDFMKQNLNTNCSLLYTDTDSLIYEIQHLNFYEIMRSHINEFDTSDYPGNNRFGIPLVNKKIVGLMKDECCGRIMLEFVGLRSKMYSVRVEGQDEIKKAKGVKTSVVKRTITFADYLRCLREDATITCEQRNIRSRLHVIRTEKEVKMALNPRDDKRCLLPGQTTTLPWGHHSIVDGVVNLEFSQDFGDWDERVEEEREANLMLAFTQEWGEWDEERGDTENQLFNNAEPSSSIIRSINQLESRPNEQPQSKKQRLD